MTNLTGVLGQLVANADASWKQVPRPTYRLPLSLGTGTCLPPEQRRLYAEGAVHAHAR